MKSLVVVLAVAGLCAAAPEADPALVLASPYNAAAISPYAALNGLPAFYNGIYNTLPYAGPYNYAPAITPAATAPLLKAAPLPPVVEAVHPAPLVKALHPAPLLKAAPLPPVVEAVHPAPLVKAIHPAPLLRAAPILPEPAIPGHNCASHGGCAVRALINAGVIRSKRESDPQLITSPFIGARPYALSPYLGYAGALPFNAYASPYAGNFAYNFGYAAAAGIPAPIVEALPAVGPAPAVVEPIVKALPAPAVVDPIVKALPAPAVVEPLVKALPTVAIAAPRAPAVVPVVEEYTRPVTYTHVGKHPLRNPATVLETDTRISHRLI